jgi:hypothetical protein
MPRDSWHLSPQRRRYLDELKIGGDSSHEIDASNGQDFTYRQNHHLHSSAGDLGRSRT